MECSVDGCTKGRVAGHELCMEHGRYGTLEREPKVAVLGRPVIMKMIDKGLIGPNVMNVNIDIPCEGMIVMNVQHAVGEEAMDEMMDLFAELRFER